MRYYINYTILFLILQNSNFIYSQVWPINNTDDQSAWNRVSCVFGEIHPTSGNHFHGAIDIDINTYNCPVRSIDNGIVYTSGSISIGVKHIFPFGTTSYNRRSRYLHINQANNLSLNTNVIQGQEITKTDGSDHLHLEMWEFDDGEWYRINPLINNSGWKLICPTDNYNPQINDIFVLPVTNQQNTNIGGSIILQNSTSGLSVFNNNCTKIHLAKNDNYSNSNNFYNSQSDKILIFGNVGFIANVRDIGFNSIPGTNTATGQGLTVNKISYKINNSNQLKYLIVYDKIKDVEFYADGSKELILTSGEIPNCNNAKITEPTISNKSDINTNNYELNANIYPNPFTNEFTVEIDLLNSQNIKFEISDINGKIISTQNNKTIKGINTFTINAKNLINGIYFFKIYSNETNKTFKLVKTF